MEAFIIYASDKQTEKSYYWRFYTQKGAKIRQKQQIYRCWLSKQQSTQHKQNCVLGD